MNPHLRPLFFLFLLAALPLVGCGQASTNLITGETVRGAYTWQQEVQIGREADQQIIAQFGLYDDPGLEAYVERMGQEVLQTSAYSEPTTPAEIRNTPFYFRLLDSDVVNAFALPGGYTYITRGLLAHLENEAQLAVVLGHEIGHVLGRHSSQRALRAQQGQIGLLGAAVLGGVVGGGGVAEGILNYGGTGVQLLFLSNSREAERESDRAGVAYAEFAGYDGAEAARFFRSLSRLSAQGGGSLPSFLSTHPDPGEREQTIPQLAAQYDTGTAVNSAAYLRQIDGLVLGTNPRQGFTENGVFYHPDLRFEFDYPNGWQVANGAAAVQIAEQNGRAIIQFTFAQESSAQAAGRAFAGQQGLQVSDQSPTRINGNTAYTVTGTASTQQGEVALLATFVEYDGNVFQFLGYTGAGDLGTYRDAFDRTARSFDRLTDSDKLNRQPVRLDVFEANRTAPFQTFLSGRPMPTGLDANGLAIMNEVSLGEQIPAGTPLKLPQR
ncbi:MAG: M48 family metalloprotease [Bacteroidota bacterium]